MTAEAWPLAFQHAAWTRDAACRGMGPAMFFVERGHSGDQARAVCATCPVSTQCLEMADANNEHHGIWGGVAVARRFRGPRSRPPIRHGTREGYLAENNRGLETCQACREANARYNAHRPEKKVS